ncbi:ABC transporter permease [Streptomyces hainanensis]|uniref:Transport permease protein n=1 Tax=Streptomyces hainanensis TaxID=402648 RepID=A0A4R4TF68_9ACTN|nr:ABC transporter permease [Streptomyces hainanensis]TDC72989.1 ABC transporter permease [Streptomyces hainanensis]
MSTVQVSAARGSGPDAGGSTGWQRVRALARMELTLLMRNRSAAFVALLLPLVMVGSSYSSSRLIDLDDTSLSRADAVLTGGIGSVLLIVVYLGVLPVYVTRREERVLKRLRAGELRDLEILAGAALPSVVLALAQCVVLVTAGTLLLDVRAPASPLVLLLGVLLGVVLLSALALATAGLTRTVESAQITGTPLLFISLFGSGLTVPLEVFPDRVASFLELLPVTGVMRLVSGGWLGGLSAGELISAVAGALAWTVLSVLAVRRWFYWEPRR